MFSFLEVLNSNKWSTVNLLVFILSVKSDEDSNDNRAYENMRLVLFLKLAGKHN